MSETERLQILDMLNAGEISAEEAEALIEALDYEEVEDFESQADPIDPPLPDTKTLWLLPFGAGLSIMGIFGYMMTAMGFFLAYLCLSPLVLVGFGLTLVGIWSRESHWIHVRVRERTGTRINISLPYPVEFTGWLVSVLEPMIKAQAGDVDLQNLDIGAMVREMGDELSPENPLVVAVDDDDDNVLVYIT